MKKTLLPISVLAAFLVAGTFVTGEAFATPTNDKFVIEQQSDKETSTGIHTITVTGKNTSSQSLSNVFVSFNLYDNSGTQVGDAKALATNVAPGSKVEMSADYVDTDNKVTSYKIVDINTY
ncbi:FxLYD domain-containing protein [Carnimonas bestiolae]|uniref:FxLYD domain-containing protein n=1 Tax=Carnimonas bestiolae TaxID=3402172 RepID=UPI003EDB805C